MILDPEAGEEKVRLFVEDLLARLEGLKTKSATFKNYQKNFKVEVTKFEQLDDTYSEVKLKQLLWESQREWEAMCEEWMKVCRIDYTIYTCTVHVVIRTCIVTCMYVKVCIHPVNNKFSSYTCTCSI